MIKKNLILLISIIIIATPLIFYFKQNNKKEPPLFKTQHPIKKTLVQFIEASGTLQAKDQITVGSLVAGKVEKIIADDNDPVKKDDILAILDNGIGDSRLKKIQALLEEAKARLAYQEKFYARQKKLFESKQISQNQFEEIEKNYKVAQAQVKVNEAELEYAQKEYNNLFIKSPDDGIVIARKIDLGEMVTAQFSATVLYIIAKDLHEMEAHVDVDESDIGLVKEGQKAIFTVDAFPKEKFSAKVKQIQYLAKIVDNVVTYATLLDVKNPDLRLRPGMTTNVSIRVAKAKNALAVPHKALRVNPEFIKKIAEKLEYRFNPLPELSIEEKVVKKERHSVWIIEKGEFKEIEVETGIIDSTHTQITKGLDESSNIIVEAREIDKENVLLKGIFGSPQGGIGSK